MCHLECLVIPYIVLKQLIIDRAGKERESSREGLRLTLYGVSQYPGMIGEAEIPRLVSRHQC